jgi:hypothetical protein
VVDMAYMRSSGIFAPDKAKPISIIGCGSIGSFVAETLAKMGFQTFHLYDGDTVEDVNIGCQRFGTEHVGMTKVEALKDIIIKTSPVQVENVHANFGFVTPDTRLPPITTIVGVDNMAARNLVWKKLKGKSPLILDGRIGGQIVRVFSAMNEYSSIEYYEKYLYTDEESVELPCTQRNVCYVANMVQSIIGRMLRNFLEKGVTEKEIGIDVESFISYAKE